MKIKQCALGGDLKPAWRHWCPGCKMNHVIYRLSGFPCGTYGVCL